MNTFNRTNAQTVVSEWISQFKIGYFPQYQIIAQSAEELGEIARELSHLYGHKKKKETENTDGLKSEIGGYLFTLICLANSKNINLMREFHPGMISMITMNEKNAEDVFKLHSFLVFSLSRIGEHLRLLDDAVESRRNESAESFNRRIGLEVNRSISLLEFFANKVGYDLQESFQLHMDKISKRDKERFESKI